MSNEGLYELRIYVLVNKSLLFILLRTEKCIKSISWPFEICNQQKQVFKELENIKMIELSKIQAIHKH